MLSHLLRSTPHANPRRGLARATAAAAPVTRSSGRKRASTPRLQASATHRRPEAGIETKKKGNAERVVQSLRGAK